MTQITFERFKKIIPVEKIYCVTVSEQYKKEIIEEIPEFVKTNIIVEPERRETGPAHALGAYVINKKDPDAVIITEAADRLVEPIQNYLSTIKAAAEVAFTEKVMVAMGVTPRYPHTGLGHIKRGDKKLTIRDINFYKLDKFVEKPELALAKKYTESGNYYWNAGEFVWRADVLLSEIKKHAPKIFEQLGKIEKSSIETAYKDMPKIAIDYAVAEKSDNFYVVHGDFNWTDIGDWNEVWKNLNKDESGNVIIDGDEEGGEIINIDTSDALIHKDGRMIAVIDVDNIIVIDTPKALLICAKSRAQNVKKIVELLKEKKRIDLL